VIALGTPRGDIAKTPLTGIKLKIKGLHRILVSLSFLFFFMPRDISY
jgi:hypothetical protein